MFVELIGWRTRGEYYATFLGIAGTNRGSQQELRKIFSEC